MTEADWRMDDTKANAVGSVGPPPHRHKGGAREPGRSRSTLSAHRGGIRLPHRCGAPSITLCDAPSTLCSPPCTLCSAPSTVRSTPFDVHTGPSYQTCRRQHTPSTGAKEGEGGERRRTGWPWAGCLGQFQPRGEARGGVKLRRRGEGEGGGVRWVEGRHDCNASHAHVCQTKNILGYTCATHISCLGYTCTTQKEGTKKRRGATDGLRL